MLLIAFVLLIIADVWAVAQTVATIFLARLFAGIGRHQHGLPAVGWLTGVIFFAAVTIGFVWLTVLVARALGLRKWSGTKRKLGSGIE